MNCMKCGRDIEEGQLFCPSCLEDMSKYPVKPGIAIQLPTRKDTAAIKKAHVKRRQPPTPEEQVRILKKRLKRVLILWLVTLVLLAATIYPTMQYFFPEEFTILGQNYSTITGTTTGTP